MTGFFRHSALGAANRASGATTELLRYACNGDGLPNLPFGNQDPTIELVQAVITAAEIEREGMAALRDIGWADELDALGQLITACQQFVSWSQERV